MNMDQIGLINQHLESVRQNTMAFWCQPNNNLLARALQLDASAIGSLDSLTLSQYTLVLSQYSVYLQNQFNAVSVRYLNAKKLYEFELYRAVMDNPGLSARTKAETEIRAVTTLPQLLQYKYEVDKNEAEKTFLQDLDKSLKLFIESLKKEMGRRYEEYNMTRGHGAV